MIFCKSKNKSGKKYVIFSCSFWQKNASIISPKMNVSSEQHFQLVELSSSIGESQKCMNLGNLIFCGKWIKLKTVVSQIFEFVILSSGILREVHSRAYWMLLHLMCWAPTGGNNLNSFYFRSLSKGNGRKFKFCESWHIGSPDAILIWTWLF